MKPRLVKIPLLLGLALPALLTLRAAANPTMDQITQSFNQNMDQEPDYSKMIPWLFGLAGAVVVVVYFRQRQKQAANPKPLNHPGKLLKEVTKIAEIEKDEMRRLKLAAAEKNVSSPLVLLLCPSLLESNATAAAAAPEETEA